MLQLAECRLSEWGWETAPETVMALEQEMAPETVMEMRGA
jgi:hypothetical protein